MSIKELLRTDAKKQLKKIAPTAIVFPAIPGLQNFEWTAIFLFFICLFTGERIAICRNVFCTKMALRVKNIGLLKKVVMDGRSAMAAEIEEYDVFPVNYLRKNVRNWEKLAVNNCDFRVSVSEKLVSYWQDKYDYKSNDHVVIPCTLDTKHFNETEFVLESNTKQHREKLGFSESDIVAVYSGSNAPWQSFKLLNDSLSPLLDHDPNFKVLFLSRQSEELKSLKEKYKGRVVIKWLKHSEVHSYLQCCDYGILLREQSDTNKVASPVKFAEYLYSGLKILITENLGDLSEFVMHHKCGTVISFSRNNFKKLEPVSINEKKQCFELACEYFKKWSDINERSYKRLIENITIN
ncbi:MAG: hypothetical protein KBG47_09250 [Bacteroidia bacterium]|nr:hypothetical protein [Bacteroidia bacterium]